MSDINKQARDKLKSAAAKAADNFDPNMFVETRDVLGLLDELEAKDRKILKLEKLAEAESVGADKAAASGVEWMKRCLAAEKLIAELETREVILPQRMDPEGYHIDEAYMVAAEDGEYLDRDEVIEAMRTAGIRINGEG